MAVNSGRKRGKMEVEVGRGLAATLNEKKGGWRNLRLFFSLFAPPIFFVPHRPQVCHPIPKKNDRKLREATARLMITCSHCSSSSFHLCPLYSPSHNKTDVTEKQPQRDPTRAFRYLRQVSGSDPEARACKVSHATGGTQARAFKLFSECVCKVFECCWTSFFPLRALTTIISVLRPQKDLCSPPREEY